MWQAETICILQLLDKHKQTKINPREKRAVAMDFAHVIFKHSPYSSCRDIISNHISMRGSRGEGGGVFKLLIFTYIKITVKGLGSLWEKFLDPRMYREWLKCMQSKIDEQYSFAVALRTKYGTIIKAVYILWKHDKNSLSIPFT